MDEMGMNKYCLGVDYGTQSGRAVLVEVDTGNIIATAVKNYTHGVMDEYLPDGKTRLEMDWALQHPRDYIEVLEETIPAVIKEAGVDVQDVIGMSVDFTACTILPVDVQGNPLCFQDTFQSNPHGYVKLWKHHAAQPEANRLTQVAEERKETFVKRYGGKISSEWLFPKLMQMIDEAPEVYAAADRFMEAGDWIVLMLTGKERRNSCAAGYKGMWSKREGYPSKDFLKALHPMLENVVEDKLHPDVFAVGTKAGELTEEAARRIGLLPGTAVGVATIDAHVAVPAVGIAEAGKMLMIMGTSTCHMVLGNEEKLVPGISGVVEDGIIPGFFGYEAGQACVGDHFDWFVHHCVPQSYHEEAREKSMNIHKLLREKAKMLQVGESGLIALDWWNGNRSVLVDADLTGVMVGMTLTTKPEEMYRALIEATAFGTNMIIETFENNGVPIKELYACGGIAEKDELMMQIYADVTNREIRISDSSQTVALGSAMFGAVAAGSEKGGYDSIYEAAGKMARVKKEYYKPNAEKVEAYKKLYAEYKLLHDYFGRGANDVMKRLKQIKADARK